MQNIIFLHKCFFSVFSSTRIKEPPRPHTPCGSFVLIFFTIYILLVKIRTISILQLTGEAREFLGLSRSSPKKGEERSIKVLTSSPKPFVGVFYWCRGEGYYFISINTYYF